MSDFASCLRRDKCEINNPSINTNVIFACYLYSSICSEEEIEFFFLPSRRLFLSSCVVNGV